MTIADANFLRGWLFAKDAPEKVMEAIDAVISNLANHVPTHVEQQREPIIIQPLPPPALSKGVPKEPQATQPKPTDGKQNRWTQSDKDKLIAMKQAGKPWKEIADALGRTYSQVTGYYTYMTKTQTKGIPTRGEA